MSSPSQALDREFHYSVRIFNKNIDGRVPIFQSLIDVKGVSGICSQLVCDKAKIESNKPTGFLTAAEVKTVVAIVENPTAHNFPAWLFRSRSRSR